MASLFESCGIKQEEQGELCPVTGQSGQCPTGTNKVAAKAAEWWPNQLNLKPLQGKPSTSSVTKGNYAEDFKSLNLAEVKADLINLMTDSKDWWPADYGHYGPFMVRMAWHAAGTYRTYDGRGGAGAGMLRFAPLNSWPDNGNLDKARRLLWPIKQKYGSKLSWADLFVLAGNSAIESMGLAPFGFGGGREDVYEPEDDIYWGSERAWLSADRGGLGDKLEKPLGAVQMGLIYVNPEGPGGKPDPLLAAQDIRETFGRMAMNDEETVALVAGGHTFGKGHGAADPGKHVGVEPEGAALHEQGFGWTNTFGTGKGGDTITSGLEGAWTTNPTKWDNGYFENLFKYEWEQTKTPAGATVWKPKNGEGAGTVPDAHDPAKSHAPVMYTTDLSMRFDPVYGPISQRFKENPQEFAVAFQKAWYKLTHRDMGPVCRLLGPDVPPAQLWQDPVPAGSKASAAEIAETKAKILASGLSNGELVRTAWASAGTYRNTDKRGGANGARVRLSPQIDWACNDSAEIKKVIAKLEGVKGSMSLADAIVLGGCAAVEACAKEAGHTVTVGFTPGRGDASQDQTDAASFAVLEPLADGFRNFWGANAGDLGATAEALLVDKAYMMTLDPAELTVLVGGLRVIGGNAGGSSLGVLTATPGKLTNDFFVNLLDMATKWAPSDASEQTFNGVDRATGAAKYTASRTDLVFGSNSQLRAYAEYYAGSDAQAEFVKDFAAAWAKVMDLDRFDVA